MQFGEGRKLRLDLEGTALVKIRTRRDDSFKVFSLGPKRVPPRREGELLLVDREFPGFARRLLAGKVVDGRFAGGAANASVSRASGLSQCQRDQQRVFWESPGDRGSARLASRLQRGRSRTAPCIRESREPEVFGLRAGQGPGLNRLYLRDAGRQCQTPEVGRGFGRRATNGGRQRLAFVQRRHRLFRRLGFSNSGHCGEKE